MAEEAEVLRVRLCGSFDVEPPGKPLPAGVMPGRQGRLVLAYLICNRHRVVARDELAELLWPDRVPDSWTTSLSAVISKLRRLLGAVDLDPAGTLCSSAAGFQLVLPDHVWIDWEVAQRAVEDAERDVRDGDHAAALAAAAEGAALAGQGFLSDPCDWVDAQRDAARELCVRAAIAAGEAHLAAGNPARAAEAAREAVDRAPGREAGYRLLMRALAASGERAEALRVWERCRAGVVEELGVEPSPETEAVYLELLREDRPPAPAAVTTTALPSGVVTFLLTDIVESSALWERNSAVMAKALARHDALIAEIVAAHGGSLLKSKLEGDATVSVFARATAGTMAALAVRAALEDEPWPEDVIPVLRMALHTGEAFERDGDYFGPALNRAARLRALASSGQILVSQAVAELVVDHLPDGTELIDRGHRDLRGLSRGENVFELAPAAHPSGTHPAPAAEPGQSARTRMLVFSPPLPSSLAGTGAPFVGRDEELRQLASEFERVLEGQPRAVLLAGEPGVGKSRLAAEAALRARERSAVVLAGRCDEGLGAPLQPFVECLRQLFPALDPAALAEMPGLDDLGRLVPDLQAVRPTAGAPARSDPDSEQYALFDGFGRLLSAVAAERPLLLLVDDLHWAGKTTLLLLRHLLRHAESAPLLIVGTFRDTELARTHPLAATIADLHRDGTATRIMLAGLPFEDVDAYLRAVGHEDRRLSTELTKITAGNPFFLIETLRHVEEAGGVWDPAQLPLGVREATGRRLSCLSDRANQMLRVAAVAGAVFPLELVEEIGGGELVDEIGEACEAGLIVEDDGTAGTFRFAHALVRQVLLAELVTLKRVRLHRTIAELLEPRAAQDPDAYLTDLARHWFECASAGEAPRAVEACRRAADRAAERLAFAEAAELYDMAAQAHQGDADELGALVIARCEALLAAGDAAPVREALADLERMASGSPRWQAWHAALAGQLAVVAEPDRLADTVSALRGAATVLREAGDTRGEALSHYVHALALERLGRIGAAEQTLDRALAAARSCGDRRLVDAVLASAPEAALWGPSPVARASGRCLDVVRVLRITGGTPAVEAVALRCQAALEALRGRLDAARTMVASARRTVEELGLAQRVLETDVTAGMIELIHGEAERAEQHLRPAMVALRERGLDGEAARAAATLGRALLIAGRIDEAEEAGQEAARLAGADLRAGVGWRGVLALTAAARGDRDRAVNLAREAVELASATDALLLEIDARMALANVLRAVGDRASAEAETNRAAEVSERKGATAIAARVRTAPTAQTTPPRSERVVRRNLSSEASRRAVAALNAGDVDAYVAHLEGCRYFSNEWGELSADDSRAYAAGAGAASGTTTPLATLGEHHHLAISSFEVAPETRVSHDWGDARLELYSVTQLEAPDRFGRIFVSSVGQLVPAIVTLYQWYADTADDLEAARARGVARAVERWRGAHPELVVEDVLELDLDHLVVEVRDGARRPRLVLRFGDDGSLVEGDVPPGRRVNENLATANARRAVAALNAGDVDRYFATWAENCRFATGDLGELTRDDARAYATGARAGRETVAVIATLGPRHSLCLSRFEIDPELEGSEEWGEALLDKYSVGQVDESGLLERIVSFRAGQLGPAIVTLYQLHADTAGEERARALAGADAVQRWRDGHPDLDIDDVLELDLDHLVVVVRDGGSSRRVELRFDRPRVRENLASELPRNMEAALRAGDIEAYFRLFRDDGRHFLFDVGELDATQFRAYASRGFGGPVSGSVIAIATLGTNLALLRGAFDMPTSRSPGVWGEALHENVFVVEVDASGRAVRDFNYPPRLLGLAVVTLFEWHAETAPAGEGVRAAAIARSLATWLEDGAVVEDVSELDLDHVVLLVRERNDIRRVTLRFTPDGTLVPDGWERFARASNREVDRSFNARDFERYLSHFAPDCRFLDYRTGSGQRTFGIDEHIAQMRYTFDETSLESHHQVLATRGERLALVRSRYTGEWESTGPVDMDRLAVGELDEERRCIRAAIFDPEDIDAAYATLDEWFDESRDPSWPNWNIGPQYLSGEWKSLVDHFSDDLVVVDHRPARLGTFRSRAEWLTALEQLADAYAEVDVRNLHVLGSARTTLVVATVTGTVEVGEPAQAAPFENLMVSVEQCNESGLVTCWDLYDGDQLDEALARYDALTASVAGPGAPQSWHRFGIGPDEIAASDQAFNARDWDTYMAGFRPDLRLHDYTGVGHHEFGMDEFTAVMQRTFAGLTCHGTLLGSRGPRFNLIEQRYRGVWEGSGDVEIVYVIAAEADEEGQGVRVALFDSEHVDAAFDKLDEWYREARDPGWPTAQSFLTDAMYNSADWESYDAVLAPDLVFTDHRLTGQGTIRSRAAWIERARSMRAALTDVRARTRHLLECPGGSIVVASMTGSVIVDDAGNISPFENRLVSVNELDGLGRVCRWDIYDESQLDEAFAQYDALQSGAETTAGSGRERFEARALSQVDAAFNSRDWDAYVDRFRPDVRITDRRAGRIAEYGLDEHLAITRFTFEGTALTISSEVVATRGDRLAIVRGTYSGTWGASGDVELGYVCVGESDAEDRAARAVVFDVDDLDDAFATLEEWWLEGRDPEWPPCWANDPNKYLGADWGDYASGLSPNVTVEDHRLTGLGVVETRDAWMNVVRSMRDALSGVAVRNLHVLDCAAGDLVVARMSGTVDVGSGHGVPFENRLVSVHEYDDAGLVGRWDIYDESQVEQAIARYEEIERRSQEPRFANAAWRANGDPSAQLVATRGERLVLVRSGEELLLVEIDENGEATSTGFAGDAVDAGIDELDARYGRGEVAAHAEVWTSACEGVAAMNRGDWSMAVGENWELHDHSPARFGDIGTEEWERSQQDLHGSRVRIEHALGVCARGTLLVITRSGVDQHGGEWETAQLVVNEDDVRTDIYHVDQLAEARARFGELREPR